jgi:hypothetical protein
MFDFTKEIQLEPRWQKKYTFLRIFLYLIFLIGISIFSFKTVFPTISFDYFFKLDGSLKNTILSPRDFDGKALEKGALPQNKKFVFDTSVMGNFSNAEVSIKLAPNSPIIQTGKISVQKSYREFFYPTGEPIGFPEGSLLKVDSNYYLISNGLARKFSSVQLIQSMGFVLKMFTNVSQEELALNKTGEEISSENYPNGLLLKIDDEYYQIKNSQLYKFISAKAYLSQFSPNQALTKDTDFLNSFEVSNQQLGFADGTLGATNTSIFILSKGKSYPIDSPETFEMLGLNWDDVIQINADELSIYSKQKLNYLDHPHPDGTIFSDPKDGSYFIIENGFKKQIIGENLIKAYLKKNPVIVDKQSLEKNFTCLFKQKIYPKNTYTCQIKLLDLTLLKGNDYQFKGFFDSQIILDQLTVDFYTAPNITNIKDSLSNIKSMLKSNYSVQ